MENNNSQLNIRFVAKTSDIKNFSQNIRSAVKTSEVATLDMLIAVGHVHLYFVKRTTSESIAMLQQV